jgi:hypothetical protein
MNDTNADATFPIRVSPFIGERAGAMREPYRSIALFVGSHAIAAIAPGRPVAPGVVLDSIVTCQCGEQFDGLDRHALHVGTETSLYVVSRLPADTR